MDASCHRRRHLIPRAACWPFAVLMYALMVAAGCASGGIGKSGQSTSLFKNPIGKQPRREVIDPEAGLEEFDAAMAKHDKQDYEGAIADFKVIVKKYYDYPVEEDAMFMIGECRFKQERYAWAQDAYDGLIKKYPSTRYLEKSTRRLFAIGAIWLNGDGTPKTEELMQVSATDVKDPEAVQRKSMPTSIPLAPNFFDKSKPLFDTPGNALKALKSVWLNDPVGPLADDAVMLTAIYYIRRGNYREADHYMDILRREYPKSEHTQTAFVVGSHIKLANYQGPKYDGRDLIDADDLIHSTLNLFPNVEDRDGLQTELIKIRERGAERYWARAQYYKGRMKPQAEAIYCETIISQFPDSEYSEKARARLKDLGPKYWTGMLDQYPDSKQSGSGATSRKAPTAAAPRLSPQKSKLSAPTPRSAADDEPQFPKSKSGSAQPPVRKPATQPKRWPNFLPSNPTPDESDESNESEGAPPSRIQVDSPEFVEGEMEGGIEQTSATDSDGVGRARP